MKAILICPGTRKRMTSLCEDMPLAVIPLCGESLVEHWIAFLTTRGAKEFLILAVDRPELVRACVGDGGKWGVKIEVIPETHELSPAEARNKYRGNASQGWLSEPLDVILLDQLPDCKEHPVFRSYKDWVNALREWVPIASQTKERVGLREISPGVWAGLHARISPQAQLNPPCWVGENVYVGPRAVLGPVTVLEDGAYVDEDTEITHSIISRNTYVGKLTEIHDSFALGETLINLKLNSRIEVKDPLLLCSLSKPRAGFNALKRLGQINAVFFMFLTSPLAFCVALRSLVRGQPPFQCKQAVIAKKQDSISSRAEAITYYELTGSKGWLRRWPQLHNVAKGTFAWVGNRPLSFDQASQLSNEFERLWLRTPPGLISLSDTSKWNDSFDDEARAHASYYAVNSHPKLNAMVIIKVIFRLISRVSNTQVHEQSVEFINSLSASTKSTHIKRL